MNSNLFNAITNETYNNKMDIRNNLLRVIVESENGKIIPKDWNFIQFLVRNNLHKKVLHIGDELVCQKDNSDIIWTIIDMDKDIPLDPQFTHSITLMMKNQFNTTVQFDAREALFYFPEGLSAGKYYFTVGAQPWYSADVNKSFMFELANAIPAGGQLVINNDYNATCLNATLSTYKPMDNIVPRTEWTTPIETVTMLAWDEENGIFLGTVDNTIQENINSMQRGLLGSNNYKESAIRQWLNSDAVVGSVWTPQTKFDRPPSWFSNLKGFKDSMDIDFLNVIKPITVKTARNTTADGGGYDITEDKFFLLSKPQIYGDVTISGVDEGDTYEYYQRYSDLNSAGTDNDSNRIKTRNNTANGYWLRSPNPWGANGVWSVSATGLLGNDGAVTGRGIAAACTIY